MSSQAGEAQRRPVRLNEGTGKYLDAAEALFLRLGYEGTSMRAIATRARVSLGTIVYHWNTKEALFRAVCLRRFSAPLEEQNRRLAELESTAGGSTAEAITPIVRALVEPPVQAEADPASGPLLRSLYGRVLTDPAPVVLKVTVDLFGETTTLLWKKMRECLPDLSDQEFYWRMTCAVGAFVYAQSFGHRAAYATEYAEQAEDWETGAAEIVAAMVAILSGARPSSPVPA
ncbi:TetR/AcrR family transcriptional regulator [Tsuneonella sp. HG222]